MARSVSISGEIDPWLVPGFSCLIIDDSDAKQNIVAHLKSVELRINATEGGYTAVAFDNAREVESFSWTDKMYFDKDLKKIVSDKMDEPQIPRWFDETWGVETKVKLSSLKALINMNRIDPKDVDVTINKFDKINSNFIKLLGKEGGESITSWMNKSKTNNTILESAYKVINDYKKAKSKGGIEDWINKFKVRRLPTITETFDFVGARTQQKVDGVMVGGVRYSGKEYDKQVSFETEKYKQDLSDIPEELIRTRAISETRTREVKTKWFDGYYDDGNTKTSNKAVDESYHIKSRRSVVDAYRNEITQNKGFAG